MPPRAPAARGAVGPALLAGLVALLFVQAAVATECNLEDYLPVLVYDQSGPREHCIFDPSPEHAFNAEYATGSGDPVDMEMESGCANREIFAMRSFDANNTAASICCLQAPTRSAMCTAATTPTPTANRRQADNSESCCSAHASKGCNNATCTAAICDTFGDSFCCRVAWDGLCAAEASFKCPACRPTCGNNIIEYGEQCDPPLSNKCSLTCQVVTPAAGVAPPNDNCSNAIRLWPNSAIANASLESATKSFAPASSNSNDTWFKFQGSYGEIQIDTCDSTEQCWRTSNGVLGWRTCSSSPMHDLKIYRASNSNCPSASTNTLNTPAIQSCTNGKGKQIIIANTVPTDFYYARVVATSSTTWARGQKIKASCALTDADCGSGFQANTQTCQCECKKTAAQVECGANHYFESRETCGCKCKVATSTQCAAGTTFDSNTCRCVKTTATTPEVCTNFQGQPTSNTDDYKKKALDTTRAASGVAQDRVHATYINVWAFARWRKMDDGDLKTQNEMKEAIIGSSNERMRKTSTFPTPREYPGAYMEDPAVTVAGCVSGLVAQSSFTGFTDDIKVQVRVDKEGSSDNCDGVAVKVKKCFSYLTWECPTDTVWRQDVGICMKCPGGQAWNSTIGDCVCPAGTTWNGTACVESACTPATRRRYADEVTCECVFGELAPGEVNPEPEGGVMKWKGRRDGERECRRGMRVRVNKKTGTIKRSAEDL